MATVLVTGGAGFVGATLVRLLLQGGHSVRVIDDFTTGQRDYLAEVRDDIDLKKTDVRDLVPLRQACEGMDAVVHLAAQSGVPPSIEDPQRDFEVNVRGTFNVLEAARLEGAGRVIFASSGAVLAGAEPPLREDLVPAPLAPYGASKGYGESLLRAFESAFGIVGVALRFSNVYGPFCRHKGSVIAAFLQRALAGEPVIVDGDGHQTRDLIYVTDIARAIVRCLDLDQGGVLHLSTGVETSVEELVALIAEIAEVPRAVEHRPARVGDPVRNYADPARAHERLGWHAEVALRDGVRQTKEWLETDGSRGRVGRSRTRAR